MYGENTRQAQNVEILPLGLFKFRIAEIFMKKILIVFLFCVPCCFLTNLFPISTTYTAGPQPALTNDDILNILTRLVLDIPATSSSRAATVDVTNHYANSIWDPSPNTLFSDL